MTEDSFMSPFDLSTGRGRLQEAVRFLRIVHEEKRNFDISTFMDKNECGTVACAAGWLCTHPLFTERGVLVDKHGNLTYKSKYVDFIDAFSDFFEMTGYGSAEEADRGETVYSFFMPSGYDGLPEYVTAETVADKIEKYLENTAP